MKKTELLRLALTVNAAFSGLTGSGALILASSLSERLGPPAWSLRVLGAGLLVFAAIVAREARAPTGTMARQIVAADAGWVIAAAVIVVSAPNWLTEAGRTVLIAITLVVAGVAAAQWRGLAATP